MIPNLKVKLAFLAAALVIGSAELALVTAGMNDAPSPTPAAVPGTVVVAPAQTQATLKVEPANSTQANQAGIHTYNPQ